MLHKYQYKGNNIVIDVNSGAVHVFDKLAWDLVDYLEAGKSAGQARDELKKNNDDYSADEIDEVWQELIELKQRGLLCSEDEFQNRQRPWPSVVKSLCLHVAHDCNLKCRYCFAGDGTYGSDHSLMSTETGCKAIDFLLTSSGARRHLEIDFFGGEPLLNFETVKQLVAYGNEKAAAKGKKIKFTLTTNAVLLSKEVRDYLNEQDISVVLSLDGRKKVHDAMRPFVGGQGSYEKIIGNIDEFIRSRHNQGYYLRGTYTRYNKDFSEDVKHMAEMGYKEISVEPVVAPENLDYAFRKEDLPQLMEEYDRLTDYFLQRAEEGKPFNFFHFNLDLLRGPCLYKKMVGCGAGHEYLAVAPNGDLYPCHQFVGQEQFKIGSVYDEDMASKLAGDPIIKEFSRANIYTKKHCGDCWAKFYCSGGCHANAWFFNQDILDPYEIGCIIEKKRLECAIYIQLRQAGLAE